MTSRTPFGARGRHRRRRALAIAGLALLATGALCAFLLPRPAGVAIDGVVLSDAEIAVGVDRVQREVQQSGGTDAAIDAAAVAALRDDLALFSVAREAGVSDIERPVDVIDRLDEVNRERETAQAAGRIVYGPVTYDLRTFYAKTLTRLRGAVLDSIEGDDLIGEDDVRARFDRDRDDWAASATTYRLSGLRVATASDAPPSAAAFRDAAAGADADDVLRITATPQDLESGAWSPEQVGLIRAADVGDLIGPMPSRGAWIVYRLDAADVDVEQAFAHYRIRIREQLAEELLDRRIAVERDAQNVAAG